MMTRTDLHSFACLTAIQHSKHNRQKGDSPVVVTCLSISLALIKVHNGGIFELLRDGALITHVMKELSQLNH